MGQGIVESRSYAVWTIGGDRPEWHRRGRAESLTIGDDARAGTPIGRVAIPAREANRGRREHD